MLEPMPMINLSETRISNSLELVKEDMLFALLLFSQTAFGGGNTKDQEPSGATQKPERP
jgi:hypothetical protein